MPSAGGGPILGQIRSGETGRGCMAGSQKDPPGRARVGLAADGWIDRAAVDRRQPIARRSRRMSPAALHHRVQHGHLRLPNAGRVPVVSPAGRVPSRR